LGIPFSDSQRTGSAPENGILKEAVADLTLENRLLKKSMIGDGGDDE
jgi:hypothetical protein